MKLLNFKELFAIAKQRDFNAVGSSTYTVLKCYLPILKQQWTPIHL